MENKGKKAIGAIKSVAKKGIDSIDIDAIREKANDATDILKDKAGEIKDVAVSTKDDIAEKLAELDNMLQDAITEYNDEEIKFGDEVVLDNIVNISNLFENCTSSFIPFTSSAPYGDATNPFGIGTPSTIAVTFSAHSSFRLCSLYAESAFFLRRHLA